MQTGLAKIKRFEFSTILGWSVSRYDKFSACKRQYFYDYYAKHEMEYPVYKINQLKSMTSVPLEIGNIVHDVLKVLLERLLVNEKPIENAKFLDFAKRKTEDYVKAKKFSEVYYKNLEKVEPESVYAAVEKGLSNFLSSPRYKWILEKAVTNKSGWVIEPPGFGETRISDMKAYCKVDFLFPVEDKIYILDWKTGKRDEKKHRKQMVGYSSWASFHFHADSSNIVPIVAYLQPEYSEMETSVNEFDIAEFVGLVTSETNEMYSLLVNIDQNIPKTKQEFPLTENRKICSFCNYRELCGRQ